MSNMGVAGLLVEGLARAGAGLFVMSPGARNLPLLAALAERPDLPALGCLDERAAGFLALGWMRGQALAGAGLRPAVVVCTSGTAALGLLPAVAEAREAGLPLVVLSADRPPEELGRGANQTTDQVGPFRPLVLEQLNLEAAEAFTTAGSHPLLERVLTRLASLRGPCQLNLSFREPLLEAGTAGLRGWEGGPAAEAVQGSTASEAAWWEDGPARARRGLVHACDLPRREDRQAAVALAELLGWPLLADGGSGLWARQLDPDRPPRLCQGEACLAELSRADFVLQLGKRPVSRRVAAALAALPGLVVDEHPGRQDPLGRGRPRWRLRPVELLAALESGRLAWPEPDPGWWDDLRRATEHATVAQACALSAQGGWSEAGVARRLALHWPADWGLLAGNSLPVRLLDQWLPGLEHDLLVAANRGLSGIDGLLATALGLQAGLGRPVAALLGDLSLLHDLGSLALLAQRQPPLLLLVLNNGGGGIFRLHAECAGLPWSHAAHGLALAPLAAALGLECAQPGSLDELDGLLEDFRARPRALVVECRVPGEDHGRRVVELERRLESRPRASARTGRETAPRFWLHGFLGSPADWDPVRGRLAAAPGVECLPCLPGHGTAPEAVPAELGGWLEWLLERTRDLPPLDLVGYSLGGRLALQLALAAPERVRHLVLLGAGPGLESRPARAERRARDEAWAARLERDGLEAFLAEWYAQPLFASLMDLDGASALLARRAVGHPAALAVALRAVSPAGQANLWPRLPELSMPVLWLAGSGDESYAASSRRAAARCPRGRLALVPGAGHAAHLERPGALADLLDPFLSGEEIN